MENWKCSISAVYKSCVTVRSIDSIENKILHLLEHVLGGLSNSFGRNRWKTKISGSEKPISMFCGTLPLKEKIAQSYDQMDFRGEP